MNDVTKDLLEALEELVAEFGVCGLTEKARAAIARAEAALAEPRPDALEQVRAEEREAHIAIVKEAFEGATISKYATSLEVLAARGMAAHLLDAIRARGEKP